MVSSSAVNGLLSAFVCRNIFLKAHDVAEFVHAVEQAGFVEWVDREGERASREGNGLGGKVNCQLGARRFFQKVKEDLAKPSHQKVLIPHYPGERPRRFVGSWAYEYYSNSLF